MDSQFRERVYEGEKCQLIGVARGVHGANWGGDERSR